MSEVTKVKLRAGSLKIPVTIIKDSGRLYFEFGFNRPLMEEIKVMAGSRYHGFDPTPRKVWSVDDCPRNQFQLQYLAGENPYSHFDQPLKDYKPTRPLYKHQVFMVQNGITYHYNIWAAEMGVGKTLSAIELMEASNRRDWFWVGPKSALDAATLEFRKWGCSVKPYFCTYEALKSIVTGWQPGYPPPHGVIFDESSRVKNHTSQRSQAAQHLGDSIRAAYGFDGFVVEMSGSPAPKSPVDWWSQCEIAWPGYLREGRIDKFRTRLALIQQAEALSGGMFPKLVTWWDDENKCKVCGQPKEHPLHDVVNMCEHGYHGWVKSTNEVQYLYERMKGLVLVCFKKDCLDLPEKQYRLIFCPPSRETMNVMQGIVASAKSTITGLTLLRELSDGFQYKEVKTGEEVCDACHGERTAEEEVYVGPTYDSEELAKVGVTDPALHPANAEHPEYWAKQVGACSRCKGSGKIPSYTREAVPIDSPKYDALENLLDEHEDVGRIVIYGGFTGTIERIVKTCAKLGWYIIKADGQGWWSDIAVGGTMIYNHAQLLEIFQAPAMLREKRQPLEQWNRYLEEFPKVAFIGQPGASGMGLTLTASPSIVYVSNDFNAESRIQSEDRIHRPGMDVNRGATIIDLIHLPSDKLVLDNLQKKRDLQSMTLGVVKAAIMAAMQSTERRV